MFIYVFCRVTVFHACVYRYVLFCLRAHNLCIPVCVSMIVYVCLCVHGVSMYVCACVFVVYFVHVCFGVRGLCLRVSIIPGMCLCVYMYVSVVMFMFTFMCLCMSDFVCPSFGGCVFVFMCWCMCASVVCLLVSVWVPMCPWCMFWFCSCLWVRVRVSSLCLCVRAVYRPRITSSKLLLSLLSSVGARSQLYNRSSAFAVFASGAYSLPAPTPRPSLNCVCGVV